MPGRQLVLRHSCSARNAYNPSLALISAFSPTSRDTHSFVTICLRVGNRPFPLSYQQPKRRIVQFSTSPYAKQHQPFALAEEDGRSTHGTERRGIRSADADHNAWNDSVLKTTTNSTKNQRSAARLKRSVNPQKPNPQSPTLQPAIRDAVAEHQPPVTLQNRLAEDQFVQSNLSNAGLRQVTPLRVGTQDSDPQTLQKKDKSQLSGPSLAPVAKSTVNAQDWQRSLATISNRALSFAQHKVSLEDTRSIRIRRKKLDYEASYINPTKSPMDNSIPIPWALDIAKMSGLTSAQILDHEIKGFIGHMDSTPAEKAAREAVIADIVQSSTKADIEVFGSQKTGFATTTSDIDFRVSWTGVSGMPCSPIPPITKLFHALQNSTKYIGVVLRLSPRPIINLQHKGTGIDVQIGSRSDTKLQQEAIAQYVDQLPHLRSVYTVLSTAFGTRGLIDVYHGGIGSYGLLMMLVASLKRRSNNPPTTPGGQLLRFLEFYSDLDTEKYGVSIAPPTLFKKHDVWEMPIKAQIDAARRRGDHVRSAQWAIGQRRLYQPYLFCLQDPADPLNDLGRKCNAIKHLRKTIAVLRYTLERDLEEAPNPSHSFSPVSEDSLLLPLVGRCHEVFYERRKRIKNYGLEVMRKRESEHSKSSTSLHSF